MKTDYKIIPKELIPSIVRFVIDEFNAVVAGTFPAYLLQLSLGEKPSIIPLDVDIYARSRDQYRLMMEWLHTEWQNVAESKNAYKVEWCVGDDCYLLSFIKINTELFRGYGKPYDIINSFDFTMCQFALYKENGEYIIEYNPKGLEDLRNKVLRIHKIICPLSTLMRAFKFAKRGFSISPSEVMKIIHIMVSDENGSC